jgi:hypothetical protein
LVFPRGWESTCNTVEAATTAEATGYRSVWTYERLLFPETPAEPYAPPNEPWPETQRPSAGVHSWTDNCLLKQVPENALLLRAETGQR